MRKCIIFDIDGTLSDPRHRLHHLERRDWKAFFGEMEEDGEHWAVVTLFRLLDNQDPIYRVVVTGRPEEYRKVTEGWLTDHGVFADDLYMRPTGDHRPDHVVKREIFDQMRADGWDPFLAIDDRPSIVQMWREAGVFCLAAPWHGEPEVAPITAPLHLMVGPSGAGKSVWVANSSWLKWSVLSSDAMRVDLLGDFADQSQNARVFEALHDIARARLRHGLPTIIDATHLRRRDRLKAAALTTGPVTYHVVDRPLEDKLATRGWRSEELVRKHDQMFKSQLKDILAGDGDPSITVEDHRNG